VTDRTLFETAAVLSAQPSIRHGFFGRQGGVSAGAFSSLNVSETSGDNRTLVGENRRRVAEALEYSARSLVTITQVHSSRVIVISDLEHAYGQEGDALVTKLPGICLGILTADCAPVLFSDPASGVVGAAHAGWKGALDGIVEETVEAMCALGAQRTRIIAAIGPTISLDKYEVGPDFTRDFLARRPDAAPYFSSSLGKPEHFDLPGFVSAQLKSAGILHVEQVGGCTYANADRYFSHRYASHKAEVTGRQMAAIGLN